MDDGLCINHSPDDVLTKLNGYMILKPESVRNIDMYLGTKSKLIQLNDRSGHGQ